MKRFGSISVFLVVPCMTLCFATSTIALPRSTQAEAGTQSSTFRQDFDSVAQLVREHFHDPKLNGVDWKSLTDTYRIKLSDVKTKSEFEALINKMLGELHASHVGYTTDDDVDFYMLPAVFHQDMSGHKTEHIGVMGSQEG